MGLFSKFMNAFKSIRLNKENAVSGKDLDHLLVGCMYAEQQGAYLNSYQTGLPNSDVKKIIEQYWTVFTREEALNLLQDLHARNYDQYVEVIYDAFDQPDNYAEILRTNLPVEEDVFKYYLGLYRDLKNAVPELVEQGLITDISAIRKVKDKGWNYGRAVFLARCFYEMSYLSEVELKEYLANCYQALKLSCDTWKDYTRSYIFGRALWGGANNEGMIQIAEDLLNHEKSPLKDKTYL